MHDHGVLAEQGVLKTAEQTAKGQLRVGEEVFGIVNVISGHTAGLKGRNQLAGLSFSGGAVDRGVQVPLAELAARKCHEAVVSWQAKHARYRGPLPVVARGNSDPLVVASHTEGVVGGEAVGAVPRSRARAASDLLFKKERGEEVQRRFDLGVIDVLPDPGCDRAPPGR